MVPSCIWEDEKMGKEIELKYAANGETLDRIRQAFPVEYRIFEMATTYYDTADFALSDRRFTLRQRMENGVPVCTLKTPGSGLGRNEWECSCGDIGQGIIELCKLGAPRELLYLTAAGVAPVCNARFTRRAGLVEYGGATLEIALDQGVLTGGGKEIPLSEAEVELKSGKTEALVTFARALAERFELTPEPRSKFRRALALAKGE